MPLSHYEYKVKLLNLYVFQYGRERKEVPKLLHYTDGEMIYDRMLQGGGDTRKVHNSVKYRLNDP